MRPVLMTGLVARDYLLALSLGPLSVVTSASYDLNVDRTDPRRKPHLEQVCEPIRLRAATEATASALRAHNAQLIVGKDQPASVLVAASAEIPYAAYVTDGAESLVPGLNRQLTADPARLAGQIGQVARELGLHDTCQPPHELLISADLNIVRGFPETFNGPRELLRPIAERTAFTGALTFDGPAALIVEWERHLAGVPAPVTYVTFGTALKDTRRFHAIAQATRTVSGTLILASDAVAQCGATFAAEAIVAPFIPNEAALRVADIIIHHGGHGTMLSALTHGVPQIVIPDNDRTNQTHHGEVLERLGIGRLIGRECAPEEIRSAVASLLAPGPRAIAREFARHVRARTGELAEALATRLADMAAT